MEKNKLFLFLFALLPGVSHMYLGMLKKGVFLMSLFLMPIALIFLTRGGLEIVSCVLPVVWCYSFFDTFRYKSYTKEERFHIDVEFYEQLKTFWLEDAQPMFLRRRKLVGWFCIFLAVYTFVYNIMGYFANWFDRILWFFYVILSKVPTLLVVIFLFKLGIDLIRAEDDDFIAYERENKKQKTQQTEQKYNIEYEQYQNETEIKPQTIQYTEPENGVQQTREDVQQTKEDVQQTREDVQQTKEDVQQIEKTVQQTEKDVQQTQNEQEMQQSKINLEKGEKIVEPIFLERRIED